MCAGRYCMVFALGAAAGAAVALIFAPQAGEKTRRQLKRNFRDASGYVRDVGQDVGKQANRAYKGAKDALEDAASRMTDCVTDLTEKARSIG